ncbi:MAG: UDP-N-acetylglucosamine 1-carboxyvinyltransferase [Oscillospiraceae bacterium]|nr:UDP-N-acetylglucosamine 1-carboxyvinyltransferase [Oscillospiraceae bacterium]
MEKIIIEGGKRLIGEINVHGAKNSALPILAATVLTTKRTVIHNCPKLTDIDAAINILEHLGCIVDHTEDCVTVDASNIGGSDIPDSLMREMRSSVVFLGAVLARTGKASFSTPGGCEIGLRPIDLHLFAMSRLGAVVKEDFGRLECECPNGLIGDEIILSFPSVGATENAILAAVTAKGTTTIINCAREPEISDLADFLNGCGAKISGAGEGTIVIEGVKQLAGTEHTVIPDRIEATTYMASAAVTQGKMILNGIIPAHLGPVIPIFEEAGCDISIMGRKLYISAPPRPKRIKSIKTMPYPGFPTDAQAPIMAMTTIADGTSVIIENIFESRYKHVNELSRLGAKIKVEGRMAVIEGVPGLYGAPVVAGDLRGGAALVVAGLAAEGITEIEGIAHIDRGHADFEKNLTMIGAVITRENG